MFLRYRNSTFISSLYLSTVEFLDFFSLPAHFFLILLWVLADGEEILTPSKALQAPILILRFLNIFSSIRHQYIFKEIADGRWRWKQTCGAIRIRLLKEESATVWFLVFWIPLVRLVPTFWILLSQLSGTSLESKKTIPFPTPGLIGIFLVFAWQSWKRRNLNGFHRRNNIVFWKRCGG